MKNTGKQTCANCEHGRWELTPTGRIKNESGLCSWDGLVQIKLPACISTRGTHRHAIWPQYTDCPWWQQLKGNPKPKDGTEPELGFF